MNAPKELMEVGEDVMHALATGGALNHHRDQAVGAGGRKAAVAAKGEMACARTCRCRHMAGGGGKGVCANGGDGEAPCSPMDPMIHSPCSPLMP